MGITETEADVGSAVVSRKLTLKLNTAQNQHRNQQVSLPKIDNQFDSNFF